MTPSNSEMSSSKSWPIRYDPHKQKYVGTWIDNMNPSMSVMEGEFDENKKEMVMVFEGIDPNTGKTEKMKSVSTMDGDDQRKFCNADKA